MPKKRALRSSLISYGGIEAKELQMQVIEISEEVLGSDRTETLNSIAWFALAYQNPGQWKEARKYCWRKCTKTKR